jgi:hypothetical protein
MCRKITKVAEQNDYQWIGICSHGSGHIYWRTVHVCIQATKLDDLMNQALAKRLPVEKHTGYYLLWLNNVAIRLTAADYKEIQELFAFAATGESAQLIHGECKERSETTVLH